MSVDTRRQMRERHTLRTRTNSHPAVSCSRELCVPASVASASDALLRGVCLDDAWRAYMQHSADDFCLVLLLCLLVLRPASLLLHCSHACMRVPLWRSALFASFPAVC